MKRENAEAKSLQSKSHQKQRRNVQERERGAVEGRGVGWERGKEHKVCSRSRRTEQGNVRGLRRCGLSGRVRVRLKGVSRRRAEVQVCSRQQRRRGGGGITISPADEKYPLGERLGAGKKVLEGKPERGRKDQSIGPNASSSSNSISKHGIFAIGHPNAVNYWKRKKSVELMGRSP